MVHFLDAAYTELRKPARELSLAKLQSLLDLVLRNSSSNSAASTDPYKEDVRVDMCSMGLMEQLLRIIGVTGALEEEAQEQKQFEADLRGKMAEEAFMMEGGSGSGVASGKSSSGRILTGKQDVRCV